MALICIYDTLPFFIGFSGFWNSNEFGYTVREGRPLSLLSKVYALLSAWSNSWTASPMGCGFVIPLPSKCNAKSP